jgi:DNA-binding CsgD family transcriptional regulator
VLLSPATVSNHLARIRKKLGVANRLELALWWLAHRSSPPHDKAA